MKRLPAVQQSAPQQLARHTGDKTTAPRTPPQPAHVSTPPKAPIRLGFLTESALKNPTRIVAGPGAGKTTLLGGVAWQALVRRRPQLIIDPTGGLIDILADKIGRCDEAIRRHLWPRVLYVDVAATDYVVPSPLYYRLRSSDTLFEIANRLPSVVKAIDPNLAGAPIMGANALTETAIHAGRIAAALDKQVDFVAGLIDHPRQYKDDLRRALTLYPELEDAAAFFREMMDPTSGPLRERRTGSLRNKLLPFISDPTMLAAFAAPQRGVDWEQVVREGKTVILDFRNEQDRERRQFKMVWWFRDFISFIKQRGTTGRGQEIFFLIDEITQLLGPQTGDGRSILAEDLNELLAVLARGFACNVVVAHQNLSQVSEAVRDILSQCGNQIIGNITSHDDRLHLARQFFRYDPYAEKKQEPVWMNVVRMDHNGFPLDYSWPKVIDYKSVEFTAEEQLFALMEKFRLPRFQFLVRPATAEGTISNKLYRLSIERIAAGQYPDATEVSCILGYLRQKDGVPLEELLAEIRNRRKPTAARSATMKHAHAVPLQAPVQTQDDDDPILREEV